MLDIKPQLIERLKKSGASPFLFIGSGFSRRYLELEDWKGLLRRFSNGLQPFNYYTTTANGDLPTVAELIAKDFLDIWWKNPEYEASRCIYNTPEKESELKDITSPLRIEISKYMNEITNKGVSTNTYEQEIAALKETNIDGIITTNWDQFIETIFPEYKVYTGQNASRYTQVS